MSGQVGAYTINRPAETAAPVWRTRTRSSTWRSKPSNLVGIRWLGQAEQIMRRSAARIVAVRLDAVARRSYYIIERIRIPPLHPRALLSTKKELIPPGGGETGHPCGHLVGD